MRTAKWRTISGLLSFLGFVYLIGAVHPDRADRKSHSDVSEAIFKSSAILAAVTGYGDGVNISSGVNQVKYVYVSSAGTNSVMRLYDNLNAGVSSNPINGAGDNTDVQTRIDLDYETENGLVLVSTCANCLGGAWRPPRLRVVLRRKQ